MISPRFATFILLASTACTARAQDPLSGPEQTGLSVERMGMSDGPVVGSYQSPLAALPGPGGPTSLTPGNRNPVVPTPGRLAESAWDVRIDYFHWNERLGGADFVNEDGPLTTLSYTHRAGPERYRIELFGGDVNYDGGAQFDDGSTDPLSSDTTYLGTRAEYDLLLEPDWAPRLSFLIGLGTRFWFRDLKGGISESGYPVCGYQETWWTVYPYLGLETRREPEAGLQWFSAARIGSTAVTYERVSAFDVTLYPRPGLTGQVEVGLRGRRLHVSGFSETMTWARSGVVSDILQPASTMITVGLKTGVSF